MCHANLNKTSDYKILGFQSIKIWIFIFYFLKLFKREMIKNSYVTCMYKKLECTFIDHHIDSVISCSLSSTESLEIYEYFARFVIYELSITSGYIWNSALFSEWNECTALLVVANNLIHIKGKLDVLYTKPQALIFNLIWTPNCVT